MPKGNIRLLGKPRRLLTMKGRKRYKRLSRVEKFINNFSKKLERLITETCSGAQLIYKFALFQFRESIAKYYPTVYNEKYSIYILMEREFRRIDRN